MTARMRPRGTAGCGASFIRGSAAAALTEPRSRSGPRDRPSRCAFRAWRCRDAAPAPRSPASASPGWTDGSFSYTSSAAPAIRRSFSAQTSASSSTIDPRAVFTSSADALHPRKRTAIDQVTRIRPPGVWREITSELTSSSSSDMSCLAKTRRHPECRRLRRNGATDTSAADDPELFAAQLGAEHEIERPAAPSAASNQPISFGDPPRQREIKRPRQLGGRLRQDVWRIGDHDAARLDRRDVDVVVADRNVRDDLQLRRRRPAARRRCGR